MNAQELVSTLQWRYATKSFDAQKKISKEDWNALEQSLVLSPSSYGLQPWKFLVIEIPELRQKLKPHSWNQTQVTDASHLVVIAFKEKINEADIEKFIQSTADARGMQLDALKAYQGMMTGDLVKGPRASVIDVWAQRQSYIALGFVMLAAAALKIDTCALEGFDPSAYDELLNLKGTGYKSVVAVALGYRSESDAYAKAKKVRFPKQEMIVYK